MTTDQDRLLAAIRAAHDHDYQQAQKLRGSWTRVPDDQVARLIEGLLLCGYVVLADPSQTAGEQR